MPQPWGVAPRHPVLGTADVHVWLARLDGSPTPESSLSAGERARARRFRAEADRHRFAASHAALRVILAGYLGCDPLALNFDLGPRGKPGLPGSGIEFNLSHSGDLAVVAVTRGRRVGVDVERLRPTFERDGIVARFFSPSERAEFAALPDGLHLDAFFRVWTCKEAYIKAIGTGLATELDSFSVAVDPRLPPALRAIDGDTDAPLRWMIRDLHPGPGYAGAVMAEGVDWGLSLYRYEGPL